MNVDLPAMTQIPLFVCIAIYAARNARVVLGEPGRNHHVPAFSTPNYLRASLPIDGNPSLCKPIPSRRAQHHYPCALSTVKTCPSSLRCASSLRVSAGSRVQGPGSRLKMVAASRESSETGVLQITSPAAAKLAEKGMAQEGWDALLEVGDFVSLSEGELLMSQGDVYDEAENREVYLMLNGECRLDVADGSVARLLPGDFIGEASFTSGRLAPRTATVRAREDGVQVVMWTWGALRAFLADPANARAKAALESYWMSGLAEKLADVMSALGGKSVVKPIENEAVQAGDYGYRYLEDVEDLDSVIPVNIVTLSSWTFAREYRALRRTFRFGEFKNTWISGPFGQIDKFLETFVFSVLRPSTVDLPRDPEVIKLQSRLSELKLGNKEIWDREDKRIAATQAFLREETRKGLRQAEFILRTQTPWFVMLPYKVLCWLLDVIFEDRPIQRFWFLETVARMPYFSYLSMLFFYETLGWWSGASEVRKIHFAEEYNELMHLRVMESLGGDTRWSDRFFARHAAIVYFWVLVVTYMVSPFLAYNFSELIESHAVDTYTEFIEANEELLKSLPPTPQALAYYRGGDMYLFDEFQTSRPAFSRRPVIKSLFDVFQAIRDDELEHVKTMFACERSKGRSMSPNAAAATPRWAEDDPSSGRATEDLRSDLLNKTPLASTFQLLRKVTFGSKTATSSSRGENENRSQKVRAVGDRKGGTGAKKSAVKEGVADGTGRNEPGH